MRFTSAWNAGSTPARAANLHLDALPEVMSFLHERGVRGYVTLNTLVFPAELKTVEQHIVRLTEAGVDAVLVQDLGLVRLLRAVSPDLAVHASTQMTLTSGECIRAAEELGIERVVLARELSIDEIREIHSQTIDRARSVRPRCSVRRLFRPVPDERIARWPQREPRPVRPGVPAAVRPGVRRRKTSIWAT